MFYSVGQLGGTEKLGKTVRKTVVFSGVLYCIVFEAILHGLLQSLEEIIKKEILKKLI